ncbi:hypothetical protein F4814DRAFT_141436 [Daldinia grandis]|nr:hypothetical protein F4814DRAFT_141436 [Daldinia grandis]
MTQFCTILFAPFPLLPIPTCAPPPSLRGHLGHQEVRPKLIVNQQHGWIEVPRSPWIRLARRRILFPSVRMRSECECFQVQATYVHNTASPRLPGRQTTSQLEYPKLPFEKLMTEERCMVSKERDYAENRPLFLC